MRGIYNIGIIREVSDYSGISMSYSYKDSIPFYIESKIKQKINIYNGTEFREVRHL